MKEHLASEVEWKYDVARPSGHPLTYAFGLIISGAALVLFGLTMLYSTSYTLSGNKLFYTQLMWGGLGVAAIIAILIIGYKRLSDNSIWLMGIVAVLLLLALTFTPINGAQRWIKFAGFTLQPSELAKPILALWVAKYASENFRNLHIWFNKHGLIPLFIGAGIIMFLVRKGNDLGTTLLLGMILVTILFVSGWAIRWFALPVVIVGVVFVSIFLYDPMRRARMTSFLDPELVQDGTGYQLWNGILALGSGGWRGVGFMESRMKALYLPEPHNDFIVSIIGEELGVLGTWGLLITYLFFAWCALQICISARTRQGMFLGSGCVTAIVVQAIINIAVVTGSIPTKGIPAPLISYGGSSLISSLICFGLLLSIAFDSAEPEYYKNWQRHIKNIWRQICFGGGDK